MAAMFLYLLCFVAFATGKEQDGIFQAQSVADMSDRELIELLVKSVSRLETEGSKQQERIEALEDTVLKQQGVICDLQETLRQHDLARDATTGDADVSVQPNNDTPDTQSAVNQKHSAKLTKNNHGVVRNVKRQFPDTPVAFSALDGPNLLHMGAHQNLVFDVANVNTNNVYNPHHGVFTAPRSGVYVITSSVLAFNNREVWCDITVNGAVRAHIYARGTDNRHDQGSQTILLHLNQGDDVTIQNEAADDAVYGELYTSFSGFLLYEEEPTAIVG